MVISKQCTQYFKKTSDENMMRTSVVKATFKTRFHFSLSASSRAKFQQVQC